MEKSKKYKLAVSTTTNAAKTTTLNTIKKRHLFYWLHNIIVTEKYINRNQTNTCFIIKEIQMTTSEKYKLAVSTTPNAPKKTTLNIIKTKDTHSSGSIISLSLYCRHNFSPFAEITV